MASADSTHQGAMLTMREASRLVGCHPNTLRAYTKRTDEKFLPCYRVIGGQRRFRREDLIQFFEIENADEKVSDSKILAYCRCSSDGQRESLTRQIERVKEFCLEQYGVEPLLFSEIGSALNYRRKKLTELLRGILAGKYDNSILVLEYKDRGMRFAHELLELIAESHGIKIVVIESNPDASEAEELQQDLLSIITIFSNRYSASKARKVLEKTIDEKAIARMHELRKSGYAINKICLAMNDEGYRTHKNTFITTGITRKYLEPLTKLSLCKWAMWLL